MGKLQAAVDPRLRLRGQLFRGKLPGAYQHLAVVAVNPVAVNINVDKIVVQPYRLYLVVGVLERTVVPQSDIVHGSRIPGDVLLAGGVLHQDVRFLYFFQVEGVTGQLDIALDVRGLPGKLAGFHLEPLYQRRINAPENDGTHQPDPNRDDHCPPPAPQDARYQQHTGHGGDDEYPPGKPLGMDVGITGAEDYAALGVDQVKDFQPIVPGDKEEKDGAERRKV